jgi:uncharacterized protein (DUF58 family)
MITWRPAALTGLGTLGIVIAGVIAGDPEGSVLGLWPWLAGLGLILVMVAVTAVDIALAAQPKLLRLTREGDKATWAGGTANVCLRIENRSRRTLRATVRDAWVPSAGATEQLHHLVLPPGSGTTLVAKLSPTRRGDRAAVRVVIRSYGPLGLGYRQPGRRATIAMTPAWAIRVLPPFTARRFLPEKLARLRVLDGATVTKGRGQGTEFDVLREYVIGDDVRSIDWRASARRSDVVVRTWRPERDRRVLCVLDTGRTSAARVGDEPRLDSSIDAALLLATLAAKAGDRVDLLAVDTAVRAWVSNTGRDTVLRTFAKAMAPLNPALVETDFGLVTGEVLRRTRKRALVVLFTALEPGAIGEGLLPVLPRLATRHKVVVAAVHDQTLPELATVNAAATPRSVYTAAAAQRTLAERQRVRAALAAYGVEVIDAPVEIFPSRVADAYLAMKAGGRL